jgi:hypothetical protein
MIPGDPPGPAGFLGGAPFLTMPEIVTVEVEPSAYCG